MHSYLFLVKTGQQYQFINVNRFDFFCPVNFERSFGVDVICKYRIKEKRNVQA